MAFTRQILVWISDTTLHVNPLNKFRDEIPRSTHAFVKTKLKTVARFHCSSALFY